MIGRNGKGAASVRARDLKVAVLPRRALPLDCAALARWLIGKRLIRCLNGALLGGRIVETEAYLANDAASHSFGGRTLRNRSMFLSRGHAYVYRIYGMWFCMNVSAAPAEQGAAVLIRALEPEFGAREMQARRRGVLLRDVARGPGRLCAALEIGGALDGLDLCTGNGALWLAAGDKQVRDIAISRRIGISKAAERQLRFFERGNLYVSGPASLRG